MAHGDWPRTIQKLLAHKNFRATMITPVLNRIAGSVRSPLDR
jgi:hypothetical protein